MSVFFQWEIVFFYLFFEMKILSFFFSFFFQKKFFNTTIEIQFKILYSKQCFLWKYVNFKIIFNWFFLFVNRQKHIFLIQWFFFFFFFWFFFDFFYFLLFIQLKFRKFNSQIQIKFKSTFQINSNLFFSIQIIFKNIFIGFFLIKNL